MKRIAPIALALLSACQAEAPPHRTIALTSQSITLPTGTATFPAAAEIVTVNCTGCHSPVMILTQPRLTADKWQAEVTKMRAVYKASIDPKDDPKLVAALLALQK